MAVKASNQIDLIDLTDGYSVILTSDSHTFIGTTSGVSGTQTATTQVMAFRGDDQIACSVGAITGLPAGLSAVDGGQSPAPTITFTATSALTTKGIVTIPVTIGDLTMHKGWSYAIAFRGTDGADGSDGDDAILLSITSSGGTIFKNTAIATTLTAHVFKGGVELTSGQISALGSVKWYKDGGATAVKTGLTLTVTAGDVDDKATYTVQLES